MSIERTKEKDFESDIEAFLLSPYGGYTHNDDMYDVKAGLFTDTLIRFVQKTQPKEWKRYAQMNTLDTEQKFVTDFNNACDTFGLLSVLRQGFKHRGISFRVCYFRPASALNQTEVNLYAKNEITCNRQWFYSDDTNKSVDMMIAVNGIPVFAFELKNQYTGQTVHNAQRQWMYDRSPREICFQFNKRILGYFCVDHTDVFMATKLAGKDTAFLPFNQGSNGAGNDGGKGNPPNPDGYPTAYLWEVVFQKESMLDILQKFIHLDKDKKVLVFPRYHQLDVVRKLVGQVQTDGAGHNYLIQHSAGSGKSNSIAWVAYRLASLFDGDDKPVFRSVIIVTDRRVLDQQLQGTISQFEHVEGMIDTIDEKKSSKDLRDAINNGARIIVTTLQKFPVIYKEINAVAGKNFAVIVDEAHSSQTGRSAAKLKAALADTEDALKEYAEIEEKEELDEEEKQDKLMQELFQQGRHKNLSFFAFTATPKDKTLELFATRYEDGSFHPFHIYSMRQAIEEGFILDVLQNYMTYETYYKIANTSGDNPEVQSSRAVQFIRKFKDFHPQNIMEKTKIIVETFRENTANKINGKGKMMVVTASRKAAVRFYHAIKNYVAENNYDNIECLIAFSGEVKDNGIEYTQEKLNKRKDGTSISDAQTKAEFHDNFNVLVVAEKYQTGFDEPYLHTMIVDKKLKGVKAVQTLSRLNRICPNKEDTFVLDFVNSKDEIKEAFQPFYQELSLEQEVNADLMYQVVDELHGYAIYDKKDIQAFCKIYYGTEKQDNTTLGKMTSVLAPCANLYNEKTQDERYQFRRKLRSFIKTYGFVTQVTRMFDKDLQQEYSFCSYLLKLLPADEKEPMDLEGMLELKYYKLQETFKGSIGLEKKAATMKPADKKGNAAIDPKDFLDEIIKKINDKYAGMLNEGDRVVVAAMYSKLSKNEKAMNLARTSDPKIFKEAQFPKFFDEAAQEGYMESEEAYTSIFQNEQKYNAVMRVLADIVLREARKISAKSM